MREMKIKADSTENMLWVCLVKHTEVVIDCSHIKFTVLSYLVLSLTTTNELQ